MAYQPDPAPNDDWAKNTTDTVVRLVGQVRDKTSGPLIKVARAVVYGALAAVLGVTALVLLAIVLVRVLDLLPGGVWVAHLIVGLIFTAGGLVLWRMRVVPPVAA